jgi:heterodisulfide reductase subunit A
MKKAVLYCTCCGTLASIVPPQTLEEALAARSPAPPASGTGPRRPQRAAGAPGTEAASGFVVSPRLCRKEEAQSALEAALASGAQAIVAAGCSLSARGREGLRLLEGTIPAAWVDIREACAWIHAAFPEACLEKAADLIRMELAALERRQTLPLPPLPSIPGEEGSMTALVAGAGPAGLACAAALGRLGVETVLVERRPAPGGLLQQLGLVFPYLTSGAKLLEQLRQDLDGAKVRLETGTTVAGIRALSQGYAVTLRGRAGEREVRAGIVALAVGAAPVLPRGYFRYGELKGVTSQMELELLLSKVEQGKEAASVLPQQAVFLQCVAARDDKNPYCSAICCPTALKNALRLRALVPGGSVTIAHRNMVTPGIHLENLYRRATEAGVALRSLDADFTPQVLGTDVLEGIAFRDALDGQKTVLPADRLVCSTPLKPAPGSAELARSIGLRLDDLGFACGREPILPLAPHLAGIYLCGGVRWPVSIEQSMEQGRAVAVKAAAFLRGRAAGGAALGRAYPWTVRELLAPGSGGNGNARIRGEACSRCARCVAACPYGALTLPEEGPVRVSAVRCGQCGSCAAVCPSGAAQLPGEGFGVLSARAAEALGGAAPDIR